MQSNEFKYKVTDGTDIHVYQWLPDNQNNIKGVMQISHGMIEHSARYKKFAEFLTNHGVAVYSHDHRGHGKTVGTLEGAGYVSGKNGWEIMVADFRQLNGHISELHKDKPLYLFGHSMGSFVIWNLAIDSEINTNGLVFSGTSTDPGLTGRIGLVIALSMLAVKSADSPAPLLHNMSLGSYNRAFKPNRTDFDWLNRDQKEVDKYIEDPFCGFIASISFFKDMVIALMKINKQKNINKIPKNLPFLLISGDNDPLGDHGKGVKEVYNKFRKADIEKISIKLYPDNRHEILHELNKEEVYQDIINWIEQQS